MKLRIPFWIWAALFWSIVTAAVFQTSVQAQETEEKTTVLGLYVQWQTGGVPESVEEVYFDEDSSRLVIVLKAGQNEMQDRLLSCVEDPQNMEIRMSGSSASFGAAEESNVKGAMVLGGGYLAALLVFVIYLLVRMRAKSGRPAGQERKNVKGEMTDDKTDSG